MINLNDFKNDSDIKKLSQDDYSKLEIGDVIWAKRYNNEIEKNLISYNHREGPYIVVSIDSNGLYCLYGTSNIRKYKQNVILSNYNYNLFKESSFDLKNIKFVSKDSFLWKKDTLSEKDFKYTFKKVGIYNSYKTCNVVLDNIKDFPYEVGDLVKINNKLYLIVGMENNKFNCLGVFKKHFNNNEFHLYKYNNNGINYYIDFKNISKFNYNSIEKRIDVFKDKDLEIINNEFNNYTNSIFLDDDSINVGSLIKYLDKLYFIYGDEDNNFLAFSVNSKKNLSDSTIYINFKKYYTNYSDCIKINKNLILNKVSNSSGEELKVIKTDKKHYKKVKKYMKKKESNKKRYNKAYDNFVEGAVLVDKSLSHDCHVVIERDNDDLYTVNLSEFKNGFYKVLNNNLSFFKYVGRLNKEEFNNILYCLDSNSKIKDELSNKVLKKDNNN